MPSRAKLLRAGRELIRRHGIGQVALDQVVQLAGLTKTTFYNHFESKEQLLHDVVVLSSTELTANLRQRIARLEGESPERRVLALFDILSDWLAENGASGCLVLSALSEFPNENDPVHAAAMRGKAELFEVVQDVTRGIAGQDDERLARQIALLVDGAICGFQACHDSGPTATAREIAQKLLACV